MEGVERVKHTIQGRTELHDAAERGDVKQVQRLLSTSVNINSRTGDVSIAICGHYTHTIVDTATNRMVLVLCCWPL